VYLILWRCVAKAKIRKKYLHTTTSNSVETQK